MPSLSQPVLFRRHGPDEVGDDDAGEGLAQVIVVAAEDRPDRRLTWKGHAHRLLLVDRERPEIALQALGGHVAQEFPDGRVLEVLVDDEALELLDRRDELGLGLAEVVGHASAQPLEVLVPVEEVDFESARRRPSCRRSGCPRSTGRSRRTSTGTRHRPCRPRATAPAAWTAAGSASGGGPILRLRTWPSVSSLNGIRGLT